LELPYIKIGAGKKTIIAFHGFGQDSSYFESFNKVFGNDYTIYSFDLPYHGDHSWEFTEIPIAISTLKSSFQTFLEKEEVDKFFIIGYSIGAKIALNVFNVFPERVDKLLMIAPDGFRSNIWYKLATGTAFSRNIFRYVIKNPEIFFNIADTIARLKLVNRGVIRFAKSQMSSQQKRDKVYHTWLCLREMDVDKSKLKLNLKKYKVTIEIFLGSEDKIITEEQFQSFSDSTEIDCKLIVLPAGHTDLITKTADFLMNDSYS